jgi:hypothetical protein
VGNWRDSRFFSISILSSLAAEVEFYFSVFGLQDGFKDGVRHFLGHSHTHCNVVADQPPPRQPHTPSSYYPSPSLSQAGIVVTLETDSNTEVHGIVSLITFAQVAAVPAGDVSG